MKQLLLPVIVLCFAVAASAQVTSIYTSTTTKACKQIKQTDEGAGYYEGICPGTGGYTVELIEGDIRQTLNIITPLKKRHELNFWGYYGGFSSVGEKIEWRVKKGVPFALIARFNVSDAEDSSKTKSYLMVSKISKTSSCVVDVIMPGAEQNADAREVADKAATMPCKAIE